MDPTTQLLQLVKCLVHIIGRQAIPVEEVVKNIGRSEKYVKAFNMCDGGFSQKEIAEKVGIKQSNLSNACKKWVENGIAFWIGEGTYAHLLHIYPIPKTDFNRPKKPKKRSRRKHDR